MKITYTVYGATAAEVREAAPGPARDFFGAVTDQPITVEVEWVGVFMRRGDGTIELWEANITARGGSDADA